MKKLLVTGSSGFIGRAVVDHFGKKYSIFRLVREKGKGPGTVYWNPVQEEIDLGDFEGFYGVIHLAGENIGGRWTEEKKETIFRSRVRDTWLLSQALSRVKRPPEVFFSASATGYYGDRGDEVLTEESREGDGFLADVCQKWEEASRVLEGKTRVVRGRFGVVLSEKGGMVSELLPIFRWGLGGKLGSGRQWMSWIALEDLIRGMEFVLGKEGVYNFTAPEPVRNKEFTEIMARAVHRRPFLLVPEWVLKMLYGREMATQVFLASTRAVPKRLLEEGFKFNNQSLSSASSVWVV